MNLAGIMLALMADMWMDLAVLDHKAQQEYHFACLLKYRSQHFRSQYSQQERQPSQNFVHHMHWGTYNRIRNHLVLLRIIFSARP